MLCGSTEISPATDRSKTFGAMAAAGGLNITFDELKKQGYIKLPIKYRKFERSGFRTSTGTIELYSIPFERLGYAPLPCVKQAYLGA